MLNSVCLCGRLVAAPELKFTKTGKEVCSFRLAVKRNASQDDSTRFFDVTLFGSSAKYISQYGNKGDLVTVDGRLDADEFVSNNGEHRRKVYVVGDSVDVIRRSGKTPDGDAGNDRRERVQASIDMLRPSGRPTAAEIDMLRPSGQFTVAENPSISPPAPAEAVEDEIRQWEDNLPF